MALPNTVTSYDSAGTVRTVMPREGVDIGPRPNFWGDLERMRRVQRPMGGTAPQQAQALLSGPGREGGGAAPVAASSRGEPIYVKDLSGFNLHGRVLADAWEPGAAFSGHYTQPGQTVHPANSQFIGGGAALTPPGITPSPVRDYSQDSNAGFDYLNPVDKARWAAILKATYPQPMPPGKGP